MPDLHGDVRYVYTSGGTKIVDYTYSAWGEQSSITPNASYSSYTAWADNNPIRYNGQYLDTETGMYYLRARYYDPAMSRFISEDPIKDGVNWYAYAGNNPVMFVDPSGLEIQISGSAKEREAIIVELRSLTRDELSYDSNGIVYISNKVDGDKYSAGTDLIREMIDNSYTCSITIANGDNQTSYIDIKSASSSGTDAIIQFNPNRRDYLKVYDDDKKKIVSQKTESYISLGHEMIHALRAMKGNRKPKTEEYIGKYIDAKYGSDFQEELDTTGIAYIRPDNTYADAHKWRYTENSLRREHGLPERKIY